MQSIEDEEEGRHDAEKVAAIGNHLRGVRVAAVYKQADQGISGEEHTGADHKGGEDSHNGALPHAGADSFILAGAQVLSGVCGDRKAKGNGCDLQQAVQFVCSGKAGHKDHAKAVDNGLKDHAANADNGILKSHRSPQPEKSAHQGFVRLNNPAWRNAGWVFFRMWRAQNRQEHTWAISVAAAAPGMPSPKPATKIISSTIFTMEAMPMASRGVLPSPTARSSTWIASCRS